MLCGLYAGAHLTDTLGFSFAKAIAWLSLDQSVDEIRSLRAPVAGDLGLSNFHLFRENVVPDFFPVFAVIGPLSEHAFVSNHPHCKVIHCHAVVLSAHYLGRHVARSARGIF